MTKKVLLLILMLLPATFACTSNSHLPLINEKKILHNAPSLNPKTLQLAIKGYQWAVKKNTVEKPGILTVIDFNQPSSEKRLWVIDLKTSKILINTYTSHGKNSGLLYAKSFSNKVSTHKTSLGVYKTMKSYTGKHGFSLRVKGLESGINHNAYKRAIVIHPADYAGEAFVKSNKMTGRSLGCFAIDPNLNNLLVNTIKGGSVIFAHADAVS